MEELKYIEFESYLKNELSETEKIAFEESYNPMPILNKNLKFI